MKKAPFLWFLFIAGCAVPPAALPPAPEASVLLRQLSAETSRWQQLDAAAKIDFTRQGKSFTTRQFVLLERPDRLRIDVLTLFSRLALQLTVADQELEVLLNTRVPPQYYSGPVDDELLARFTRVPLRAAELVPLLLYAPPQTIDLPARVTVVDDRYRLTLGAAGRMQHFFFDPLLRLRRALYLRGERVLLAVDYDQIDPQDLFPRRVQIALPQQQIRVSLEYSDIRLNQPVKAGRFDLKPPADAAPLLLPGLLSSGEDS